MAIQLACQSLDHDGQYDYVTYQLTFSNSDGGYKTGGDNMDVTIATDPKFLSHRPKLNPPVNIAINGFSAGFTAVAVIGTTNKNSKLVLFTANVTELAAGNYPSNLLNDKNMTITFQYGRGG